MQREFESLMKQATEMTKLASPVYPELDPATEHALWAQAEKNVPNPGIPSRLSDDVKEIAYPLAGLGAGVAGYKVTNPLAERAVAKFAPTHAANPRSALNLAAVGVPALLPLAGMFGGIKASEANEKQNNIARYNHSNNVEQAYYDLREKMAGDFAGLMKQASEMVKRVESWSTKDEVDYQNLVKKHYNNPESNRLLAAAQKRKAQDPKTYAQSAEYANLKSNVDRIKGGLSKDPLAQRAMKKQANEFSNADPNDDYWATHDKWRNSKHYQQLENAADAQYDAIHSQPYVPSQEVQAAASKAYGRTAGLGALGGVIGGLPYASNTLRAKYPRLTPALAAGSLIVGGTLGHLAGQNAKQRVLEKAEDDHDTKLFEQWQQTPEYQALKTEEDRFTKLPRTQRFLQENPSAYIHGW